MQRATSGVSIKSIHRYLLFAKSASAASMIVGILVLVGWALDIALLKSLVPKLKPMQPNTAVGFILLGVALWQSAKHAQMETVGWKRQVVARVGAWLVGVVGAVSLSEDLWRFNLGIDELLFRRALLATHDPIPGRMAQVSGLEFALLGFALVLLNAKSPRRQRLAQNFALAGIVCGVFTLAGYAYEAKALYRVSNLSSALLFPLLSLAILCLRPDRGLISTLTSPELGGALARRILPVALTLPFLIGWLRLQGQQAGLYGTEFGLAIFTTSTVLIFAVLVWFGARSLNHSDAERQEAAVVIQQSEERFRTMANSIPQLAWMAQADGYIDWYNQRWYEYTGTRAEQMKGWGWQSVHDPLVLPQVLEQWRASIATGQPFEMEFPLRGADGLFRSFLTRGSPLKDAEGRVMQWFGTNTDIAEHQRAEAEIRQAKTCCWNERSNFVFAQSTALRPSPCSTAK